MDWGESWRKQDFEDKKSRSISYHLVATKLKASESLIHTFLICNNCEKGYVSIRYDCYIAYLFLPGSLNPLAKGFLSIFSLVIYEFKRERESQCTSNNTVSIAINGYKTIKYVLTCTLAC